MRVAAILGLGCSAKDLQPFQTDPKQVPEKIEWRIGMPAAGQADVILLFGGDGTIHRHLAQLVRLGLPVLVVPAGSGNDFARALGSRSVRHSLTAWQKFLGGAGNVRTIDLGLITPVDDSDARSNAVEIPTSAKDGQKWGTLSPRAGVPAPHKSYFCCVAGVGLDCEVARRANQLPRWLRGHGGYALGLLPTIFTFAPFPMKIRIRDEGRKVDGSTNEDSSEHESWTVHSDQPTLLAAFANAPVYGGGMKIAPRAQMDDGVLDVCVVGGVDPFKLFCMFPTVYRGAHLKIREVTYFSARRASIETEHPMDVYADGEYICRTPAEIGVEASVLRVIVL